MGAGNIQEAVCLEAASGVVSLEVPGVGRIRATAESRAWAVGQPVRLHIRPEQVRISAAGARDGALQGTIKGKTYLGRHIEFAVELGNGRSWTAHVRDEASVATLDVGSQVFLEADPAHVIVFAAGDSAPR